MTENVDLLTVDEFAATLTVKPACIRRWIAEEKVTVVHIGRLVRIPKSEIGRIVRLGTRLAKAK